MTSHIISGGRKAEEIAKSYLERLASDATNPAPHPIPPTTPTQPTIIPTQASGGFYTIDKTILSAATTPAYRTFLRDAGYADLDTCSHIQIAQNILTWDQTVRDAALRAQLVHTDDDKKYVVNINQSDGRKLVESMSYKLLTTNLMYNVFIPYIKQLANSGNTQAQATLKEMTDTKAEWLDDIILNKNTIKIGNQTRPVSLPAEDGRFNTDNINEFGYPTNVTNKGEFYYWFPRDNERAAFRYWDSVLGLGLGGVPSGGDGWLGVRLAKIFP